MTNAAKATVWDVIWTPWGAPHTITGAQTLNARFPGQWFQLEAGLHYNWHRHYDPSLGRYTQPDPLGFVDGPSVYAYARSSPATLVDFDGEATRPSQRWRQCNNVERVQCYSECAKIGKTLKSCRVARVWREYPAPGYRDGGKSCNCYDPLNEPDEFRLPQCNAGCQKFIWKLIITAVGTLTWVLVCVGA